MGKVNVIVTAVVDDNDHRPIALYEAIQRSIEKGEYRRADDQEEPLTFGVLQEQVTEWVTRNFDTSIPEHPLMGLIEEIGELCKAQLQANNPRTTCNGQILLIAHHVGEMAHALLKTQQGIRGSEEVHLAHFQEHLVATAAMLKCIAINLKIMPEEYVPAGLDPSVTPIPAFSPGKNPADEREDAVADVAVYMADFCTRNKVDQQASIERTWKRVQKRDWNKHRATGEAVE